MGQRKAHVIRTSKGRLGNRLVPDIAIAAYCMERGIELVNDDLRGYVGEFARTEGGADRGRWKHDARWRVQRMMHKAGVFGPEVKAPSAEMLTLLPPSGDDVGVGRLGDGGRKFFVGWRFWNPVGVVKHHNALLERYRPAARYAREVASYKKSLPRDRLVIALHIRQTDFRDFEGGKYYVGPERFAAVARELVERRREDRPVFYVYSDGALDAGLFDGIDVQWRSGSMMGDWIGMSLCDGIVSTGSTFAMSAALVGDTCMLPLCGRLFDNESAGREWMWWHLAGNVEEFDRTIREADTMGVRVGGDGGGWGRPVSARLGAAEEIARAWD